MTDEEFVANLRNIDNEKLIQSLQNCGHDGYYNDLYYPIIEEIKRRLSLSPSAEPERMKGEWIYDTERVMGDGWTYNQYHCSECGQQIIGAVRNFCPYCGAEMNRGDR